MTQNKLTYLCDHFVEFDDKSTQDLSLRKILFDVRLDCAQNSDGQARPRKGVALGQLGRKTQLLAELTDFILYTAMKRDRHFKS